MVKKKILMVGGEAMPFAATGGLGEIISKESNSISQVDRTLTLDGLKTIYQLNK